MKTQKPVRVTWSLPENLKNLSPDELESVCVQLIQAGIKGLDEAKLSKTDRKPNIVPLSRFQAALDSASSLTDLRI